MDELRLTVGGRAFTGWETVELTRSIEALCGSFRLRVSDKLPRGRFPIADGEACELYIGRDLYLSGYVDAIEANHGAREHTVSVEGRDLAQDLVDCSPVDLYSEYYDVGLLELARLLAEPFGVTVLLQPGADQGSNFLRFAITVGETAHEALERACRMRSFMLISDARGVVTITQAGASRAPTVIREGQNVISARWRNDRSGRFSRYLAYGQMPGSDLAFGSDCAESRGEATDPVPRAQRSLVLNVETSVDDELAQARAVWEANVRAARSRTLTVVVNGWRQKFQAGSPWVPNELVQVDYPTLGVSGDWLIAGVRLALSVEEGQIAELALVPPDSFLPRPPDPEIEPDLGPEDGG